MNLSVAERIYLLHILPREGNAVTLRLISDLRKELSFSDAEHTDFQFVATDEKFSWNPKTAREKDIHISPAILKLIKETLTELDKNKKLSLDILPLYERFAAMTVAEIVTDKEKV